jgi:molybdopterin synthase sulfur carrier subunit
MITVEFLGPIGIDPIQLEVTSLSELKNILQEDQKIAPWLENSAIAINDCLIKNLETPLKDGDKVSLLPPVCGG